ncbi:MAG: PaaI family thioesterase [Pseudomonadota bacterium]
MTQSDPGSPPPPPEGYDPASEEVMGAMSRGLGIRIAAWREGFGAVEMPISERVINRQGVVHGGAIATLIDTAAGYAVCYCPYPGRRRNAFTLSLTTNYLSAGRDGILRAEAWITGGGAAVKFVDAKVIGESAGLIATATGVFRLRSDSLTLYGAPRDPIVSDPGANV